MSTTASRAGVQPELAGDPAVLVRRGEPAAVVVLPAKPHEFERAAADELVTYIEKISGAHLDVLTAAPRTKTKSLTPIYIGSAATAESGTGDISLADLQKARGDRANTCYEPDGFVLSVHQAGVSLAGVRPEGTVYAAVELLDRLGCRWFFPGELGEVVPQCRDLALAPCKSIQAPSFEYRHFWVVALQGIAKRGATPVEAQIIETMNRWHRHSRSTFEDNAAEYGHAIGGTSINETETVKLWTQKALDFFKENPDVKRFSLGWADNYCPVGEDEALAIRHPWEKRWSATDPLIAMYNKIAENVTKELPGKEFGFLAYLNYLAPPISVRPHPSLLCAFAPIEQCPRHLPARGGPGPARVGGCWQRDATMQALETWCELSDKVILFDYDPQFLTHGSMPVPCVTRLKVETPLMHAFGLRGVISCGQLSVMNQGPQFYVRARQYWDVNASVDELVDEYFTKLYGPAAEPARAFWDALEEMMHAPGNHQHEDELMKVVYPIDKVRALERHIERAESEAGSDVVRRRVQILRYCYDNMMLYLGVREAEDEARFADAAKLARQMVELHEQIERFDPTVYQRGTWNRADETKLSYLPPGWARQNDERQACIDGTNGDLVAMLPATWQFQTDPHDEGILYRWFRNDHCTGGWRQIEVTRVWDFQGYEDERGYGYDGVAWYRTEADVSAGFAGRSIQLNFGGVFGRIHVWVNGQFVAYRPFKLPWWYGKACHGFDVDVTTAVRAGEANTIVIRVDNEFEWGGIFRRVFLWSPKASAIAR